jgi:hypothetical protein
MSDVRRQKTEDRNRKSEVGMGKSEESQWCEGEERRNEMIMEVAIH